MKQLGTGENGYPFRIVGLSDKNYKEIFVNVTSNFVRYEQ